MIPLRDNIPTRRTPVVTIALIAANILVFLNINQVMLGGRGFVRALYLYGLIPLEFSRGRALVAHPFPLYMSLFTSMFVHGGLFHVAGNMLYLWIFGNNVEDSMSRPRFLVFYLLAGIGAAMLQIAVNPSSKVPMVGASGAISGILGAYLLLFPGARVVTLVGLGFFWTTVEIPALIVLGFWIMLNFFNGLVTFTWEGGGVAWFAHVGGFLVGMALVGLFKRRGVRWGWQRWTGYG